MIHVTSIKRVMSHVWMSRVTRMKESCYTYTKSHVTSMNEFFHPYKSSHVTHISDTCYFYKTSHVTRMHESCYTYTTSHVTGMNESCHTYEWVMLHIWMSHVTHMNVEMLEFVVFRWLFEISEFICSLQFIRYLFDMGWLRLVGSLKL